MALGTGSASAIREAIKHLEHEIGNLLNVSEDRARTCRVYRDQLVTVERYNSDLRRQLSDAAVQVAELKNARAELEAQVKNRVARVKVLQNELDAERTRNISDAAESWRAVWDQLDNPGSNFIRADLHDMCPRNLAVKAIQALQKKALSFDNIAKITRGR